MRRTAGHAYRIHKLATTVLVFGLAAGIAGCSSYSQTSYDQVSELKVLHVTFVGNHTAEKSPVVDASQVASETQAIGQKFQEAETFAQSTKDKPRTSTVEQLHALFDDDVELLKEGKAFSKAYASEKTQQLVRTYDEALKAEADRK